MADYVGAFKQGLEAAAATERAKKEIEAVFIDFNHQISKATGGKILIDRKEYEIRGLGIKWPSLTTPSRKAKETYWVIVASNPLVAESTEKKLAGWSQDLAGYPCKITMENLEYICEDKEALENSLAELLKAPLVGEKLNMLMQLEKTSSEKQSAQKKDALDKE